MEQQALIMLLNTNKILPEFIKSLKKFTCKVIESTYTYLNDNLPELIICSNIYISLPVSIWIVQIKIVACKEN